MNRKLPKEDKEWLRAHYRNKAWDLGYYLLADDVRGEDFDYIMQGGETMNAESPKQRQEWLAGAMKRMEERLPAERIKRIRESSACCLGGARGALAKQIHDEHATVDERFAALAEARLIIGGRAEKLGENKYYISFFTTLPEKPVCSCLHYTPRKEPMSASWCLCCGGHIKHHFETALGVRAEVKCLSSILTSCGKEPCAFELTVLETLD